MLTRKSVKGRYTCQRPFVDRLTSPLAVLERSSREALVRLPPDFSDPPYLTIVVHTCAAESNSQDIPIE